MEDVSEVIRIRIGSGEEEPAKPQAPSPPSDWFTLAARAAVGLVSLGAEASIQIIRMASGTPEQDQDTATPDTAALLVGAALGLAIEAVRTAATVAELGPAHGGSTRLVPDRHRLRCSAPRRRGPCRPMEPELARGAP